MPDIFDLLRWKNERTVVGGLGLSVNRREQEMKRQTYAELVADPRWQVYFNWVTAERAAADREKVGLLQILETSFLAPDAYGILKVKLANVLGRRDAMDHVLGYISNILQQEHVDAPSSGSNGETW